MNVTVEQLTEKLKTLPENFLERVLVLFTTLKNTHSSHPSTQYEGTNCFKAFKNLSDKMHVTTDELAQVWTIYNKLLITLFCVLTMEVSSVIPF